eukprot:EG_transcript_44373
MHRDGSTWASDELEDVLRATESVDGDDDDLEAALRLALGDSPAMTPARPPAVGPDVLRGGVGSNGPPQDKRRASQDPDGSHNGRHSPIGHARDAAAGERMPRPIALQLEEASSTRSSGSPADHTIAPAPA